MPDYKNKFNEPDHVEYEIVTSDGSTKIGTIRLKPSGVLWKPKNAHKFYSVDLTKFSAWMEENGKLVKQ